MKTNRLNRGHKTILRIGLILGALTLLGAPVEAQEVNYKKANYVNAGMGFNVGPNFGYIRELDQLAIGVQIGRDGQDDRMRWVFQTDVYYSLPIPMNDGTRPFYARSGVIASEFVNNENISSVLDAALSVGYRLGYHNATIGTNYLGVDVGVITAEAFTWRNDPVLPTASVRWCFGF